MTGIVLLSKSGVCGGGAGAAGLKKSSSNEADSGKEGQRRRRQQQQQQQQISLLEFLLSALRKSMVSCRIDRQEDAISSAAIHHMEIGWPTNVQHITHVTFDRFHGFLGLPVEFEVEVPCRVPSASVSVFGVSAESMQCSYDARGNSVPTILLLMQDRLLSQGGMKAEGIFRINPENSKEEHVRDQLNRGIVPEDIDVHCLAGLIKAWFRELPSGVLDDLSPEHVLECNTEEDSVQLIEQLKPTARALLNWAVDLMADVVEHEGSNKMNARNIAMVFAPNMTQMSDPLTALMHAVQVMNLLKTLIMKTLREREYTMVDEEVYSPLRTSCHSSIRRQTDEEMESQEDMDTSCESMGPISDDDDDDDANLSVRSDVDSLSDIEESFLRQLGENENAKNDFKRQLEGILIRQQHLNHPSSNSSSDTSTFKAADSCFTTSDGEDSKMRSVSLRLKEGLKKMCSDNVNKGAAAAPSTVQAEEVESSSLRSTLINGKSML